MKSKIYLNEFNIPTNNTVYLPYSSGLLWSYASKDKNITDNYELSDILFYRDNPENILKEYKDPFLIGFSSSIWNFQLNLYLAKHIKLKYPECIIVFGGPNVPPTGDEFFKSYPFIDFGVYGEGEQVFSKLLLDLISNKLERHKILSAIESIDDLDDIPSPYVNGIFDKIIDRYKDIQFKTIIETNRSCPFSCTFCFWGKYNLTNKIKHHSVNYVKEEAEWIGRNKIPYVFCADANFGMFKRDVEIAQIYSDVKAKNKYPEKFRVCYGKNATDSIFQTAVILSKADLAKTVTLAIQSDDKETLKNVKRSNIKKSTFHDLQIKYTTNNIPTYTEIILGLPGETKESFLNGLDNILDSIINNQVFIYHCQIIPNTEMAEQQYKDKHGLKTVFLPLAEVHGNVRILELVPEYDEIIIGTNTMSTEDWKECALTSWIVQTFHGLKVLYETVEWLNEKYKISRLSLYNYIAMNSQYEYIRDLEKSADRIINSGSRCIHDIQYGDIYYEPEEVLFIEIAYDKDNFYKSITEDIVQYLIKNNISFDKEELLTFIKQNQIDVIPETDTFTSKKEYATNILLYGRKSNKTTKKDITLAFS
jgi:putative methyltransferase